jgi:hypothetical protein
LNFRGNQSKTFLQKISKDIYITCILDGNVLNF